MTFADEVTTDTPVVWWDTRQISGGSQPDRSGNGHTGTVTGSPTIDTTLGAAFDNTSTGDDQYVRGNASFATNGTTYTTFSFETVVKFVGGSGFTFIVFDDATETTYSGLFPVNAPLSTHDLGLEFFDPNPTLNAVFDVTTDIGDDTVHHLVGEYDGTHANLYVDGSLVKQVTPAHSGGMIINGHDALFHLADDFCACGDGLTGTIRHGIFYSHSLGATRVAAHATAALSDDPAPPLGGGSAPVLSSVDPVGGHTAGGNQVLLIGENFTGATAVTFGGSSASYDVVSDTDIVATAPAHAAGAVAVVVTTPSGSSS